jgi:hypothetical protein
MVLMTHNTDIADAWDREGEDRDFFYNLFPDGHAVGINVLLYDHGALTPCASDSEPRGRDCGKSVKYPVGV